MTPATRWADDQPPLTELTEAQAGWREEVRAFAAREVAPLVRAMDERARIDAGLLDKLFDADLMAVEVPAGYGGRGGTLLDTILAIEALAEVDPAVAVLVDVQNALVVSALLRHGSGEQKRRFLPRLASGAVGAYAISETDAGSDAFAMRTSAVPDEGGYVLTGRKAFTTSAAEASVFLVFARTTAGSGTEPDPGSRSFTAFLVERDRPGVRVGDPVAKLGIRASSTCDVEFDEVRIGPENVLGEVGDGTSLAVETLNIGKLGIAAQQVGLAQGALEAAVGYARKRRQFGEPVMNFQGVAFPLASLATQLEAARLLVYNGVRMVRHPDAAERLRACAMAKQFAAEVAERTASHAVETLGGVGFTTDGTVEKFYRDAKIGSIYEGTTNMQFRTISSVMFR
ncbi:acyl-CoA dehydrogenase family protein [Streptomyces sp. NPDC088864]|uniref:acyl-CoA dehydrogenase family protein n=1 Tax=Streptomyces sp. NPDC088864 TaxID=3365910 RepID=UPI0037FF8911